MHIIADFFVSTILPALTTLIAGMVVAVLKRYLTKLGLDVDAKQEERLKELAIKAVLAVEEQARRKQMTSAEKASKAESLVRAELGIDKVSGREIGVAVDAAVPEVRARLTPSTPATFGRN